MQWWCAATDVEWTWAWRAYPGVWLTIAMVAGLYLYRIRRLGPVDRPAGRLASFTTGVILLWAALDWPVGALGAGYLLSVHSAQYVVLTLAAMPLLLAGIPEAVWPPAGRQPWGPVLRALTHPGLGLFGYTAALGVTHVPPITDSLMASQPGSFAIDLVWLLGGFLLWWPVLAPDRYRRMAPPVRIGYLFVATIPPTVPAAFMVFADYPLYGLYELAPRVGGITAATDQQAAGVLMKAAADPMLWVAMAVIFFRWYAVEEREEQLAKEAVS